MPHHRLLTALLTLQVLSLAGCEIKESEFKCERALTHLASCCGELEAPRSCDENIGLFAGFLSTTNYEDVPVLSIEEAECVLKKPCAKLRPICDDIESRAADSGEFDSGWTELPVCSR